MPAVKPAGLRGKRQRCNVVVQCWAVRFRRPSQGLIALGFYHLFKFELVVLIHARREVRVVLRGDRLANNA